MNSLQLDYYDTDNDNRFMKGGLPRHSLLTGSHGSTP